jgi:hypothetical protein
MYINVGVCVLCIIIFLQLTFYFVSTEKIDSSFDIKTYQITYNKKNDESYFTIFQEY